MEEKLVKILNEMADYLNISQMKKLQETLLKHLAENEAKTEEIPNVEYLKMFIDAKQIEGCSERTLQYYRVTIEHMLGSIDTPIRKITTDEIRGYLVDYQKVNNCSKVTVDNVRRNMSSFFSWLEEEDYILKSPMRRIHKIKTKQPVKETITDEMIEKLRDNCTCVRDLAMIDLLYSTGIRVGELVGLNISDRKHDDEVTVPYLLRVLKAESIRLKMAGRGANIQNLNQQILETLIIPVPPKELQLEFAAFVHQVDKSKLLSLIKLLEQLITYLYNVFIIYRQDKGEEVEDHE